VKHLVLAAFIALFTINSAFANEENNSENPVVEIVVFKVTEPEAGIEAALALIEDATAFNNAIISSEIYQSASDPNTIAQRIVWKTLKDAKDAVVASEKFPNMEVAQQVISEILVFDHFRELND